MTTFGKLVPPLTDQGTAPDKRLEYVARAVCRANGDDPDALAYPPMMHMQAKKRHVVYVPVNEWHQPRPCWTWYVHDARIAIDALREYDADLRPRP